MNDTQVVLVSVAATLFFLSVIFGFTMAYYGDMKRDTHSRRAAALERYNSRLALVFALVSIAIIVTLTIIKFA